MSSPFRKSSQRSSPAVRDRRRPLSQSQTNGYARPGSSSRENTASPSRQLVEEFSKVFISDAQGLKLALDSQTDDQEKLHRQALARSLAEHEAVRESAEKARLRVEIEIARELKRRQEEEQIKLHEAKVKAEREEHERKQREAERQRQVDDERLTRQREAETRQAAALKQKQETEAQAKREADRKENAEKQKALQAHEEKQRQELLRRRQEEEDRKKAATEEPLAQQLTQTQPNTKIPINGEVQTAHPALTAYGVAAPIGQRELDYRRYLTMHKKLKEMRQYVLTEASKHTGLKNKLGDMRRSIKKSLSIFNAVDKTLNRKPTADIRTCLEEAARIGDISLCPKDFIVALDKTETNDHYPGPLLYLIHYFAKYVIQRFIEQVGRDAKSAEPYGIIVAQIFTLQQFHFNGHSLIDILWAKYYKVCPVLFGVHGYGDKTTAGRHRLGWKFEKDDSKSGGQFITSEDHLVNQSGLAVGFASITLRDFSKSQNKNPAPNRMFWTSLACLLSMPLDERTDTHYVVLRSMLELSVPRFIAFFGGAAIAAMRKAFLDWPREATDSKNSNVLALGGMPRVLAKEYDLYL